MNLTGLKEIYRQMKVNSMKRYKFGFSYNNIAFDIFYFIDEIPNKLIFGVIGDNCYFELDVKEGFEINTYLGDIYAKLCSILGLQYNPNSPFKTTYFFEAFNNAIPKIINVENKPKPEDIARYSKDIEDSEKVYFMGWLDNEKAGNKVRDLNLEKTRRLLGYDAYVLCKQKNISSRWTDDKAKAIKFFIPI